MRLLSPSLLSISVAALSGQLVSPASAQVYATLKGQIVVLPHSVSRQQNQSAHPL